jgi:hypothetical protein
MKFHLPPVTQLIVPANIPADQHFRRISSPEAVQKRRASGVEAVRKRCGSGAESVQKW